MTLVASRITDKVMMEFNDDYKRKMAEEDKHTVKDDESLHTLVQKFEPEHGCDEGMEGSAASISAFSSGQNNKNGGSSLGLPTGGKKGKRPSKCDTE